ncbi:hypothetical protein BCR34DRAFT_481452 [Clohesyomyces aquaticus]|uniref:Zn(2)-C6 fungal-type domain-containing protein n=1 Tax=Clohesyomyces aquaticus TaxID=1231657 RepID=A0A1Y1ZTL0_9PLEO|nr:hypothetical protein BCR34DRAFT_481452 [Clohesyomyces aquaticus]
MATPRRKACVECRQQKIRCDVEQHKTPHDPCGRCNRMGLQCRILPTSTRNLRQTKAEMRRELEELKWNMRQGTNEPGHMPSAPDIQNLNSLERTSGTFSNTSGTSIPSPSLSPSFAEGPTAPSSRHGSQTSLTLPRALDGHTVDPRKIDACWILFFTQYHDYLPILDPNMKPNECYDLSPFLFWSIVVTGSRRYADDPAILDKISMLITPLAFSSMALRSTPIPVIQGLLILCTWRLPTNSMYKDMTHVLCGAAVHLATQVGLHVAGVGQDFARMPLEKNQDQTIFRAKLWLYCVIVSIRSSCAEGIPPLVIAESFFDGEEREREDVFAFLPGDLQFLHKIYLILLRAMAAMVRTDVKSPRCDPSVLRSMISIFDSQLLGIAPSSPTDHATFQLNCCRVHVLAFHFFAPSQNPDVEALSRLYSLCVSTVQAAKTLVQTANLKTVCSSFIDRSMNLMGFVILKISRSPLAPHLDLAAGEQAYSFAVQFSKDQSLLQHDIGARCAAIMTQLWGSSKIFRRRDGRIESLGLRLRTRLSMSVSFDMFWYWREEFGNMSNPYNNSDESAAPPNPHTQPATPRKFSTSTQETMQQLTQMPEILPPIAAGKMPTNAMTQIQPTVMDMSFDTWNGSDYGVPPLVDFPDYDWAASFDFSNGWPSGPLGQLPNSTAGFNFSQPPLNNNPGPIAFNAN